MAKVKQPKVISLRKLAAGRFKLQLEETWKRERVEVREPDKHWYEQIPCKCGGFISLYSEDPPQFKFYTPLRRKACRELFAAHSNEKDWSLDCTMDGDETVLIFPAKNLHEVALAVGAYKKRQYSEATKEKLRERLKAHQFKKGQTSTSRNPENRGEAISS